MPSSGDPGGRDQALEARLRATIEELQVHQAELQAQNDELVEARAEIERSHRKYFELFDLAPIGYVVFDRAGVPREMNLTAAELLGRDRSEVIGAPFLLHVGPSHRSALQAHLRLVFDGERAADEIALVRGDGTTLHVHLESAPVRGRGDRSVVACRSALLDVSARRRAEEEREAARSLLQRTIDTVADPIAVIAPDRSIRFRNRALARRLAGARSCIGCAGCRDFDGSRDCGTEGRPCALEIARRSGEDVTLTISAELADGVRLFETLSSPLLAPDGRFDGIVQAARDVTERRRMLEDLSRTKRIESLGVLAGGVAHDFNNILTAVRGNLTLAARDIPPESPPALLVQAADRAAARAVGLSQQLLTFSRGGEPMRSATPLAEVVRDAAEFPLHGSSVRAEIEVDADLWHAFVDPNQMSQVVQNLVLNAADAMPAGGTVRISLDNLERPHGDASEEGTARYVRIRVRDTGNGIRPEHLERVFEPYFSTKGTGSGLGLAVAHSIVRRHEGFISIDSVPSIGTTVTVGVPATDRPAREAPRHPAAAHRTGRILVMDDDEMVLQVATLILGRAGHEVVGVSDGAAAVQAYAAARAEGCPFDVVLLDLTVPGGVGGQETLERLRAVDPDVRGVVSSGYADAPVMAEHHRHGFRARVAKPYGADELRAVLDEVLADA